MLPQILPASASAAEAKQKLLSVLCSCLSLGPRRWPGWEGCLGAHCPSLDLRKTKEKTVASPATPLCTFSPSQPTPPAPPTPLLWSCPGQEARPHCQQVLFAASQVERLPARCPGNRERRDGIISRGSLSGLLAATYSCSEAKPSGSITMQKVTPCWDSVLSLPRLYSASQNSGVLNI